VTSVTAASWSNSTAIRHRPLENEYDHPEPARRALAPPARLRRPIGAALYTYAAFLGIFVGHATTHILGTLLFDGYTAAVITTALGVGTLRFGDDDDDGSRREMAGEPLKIRA
jgi:hypothetical protein